MNLLNETVAAGVKSKVSHFSFEFRFRGDQQQTHFISDIMGKKSMRPKGLSWNIVGNSNGTVWDIHIWKNKGQIMHGHLLRPLCVWMDLVQTEDELHKLSSSPIIWNVTVHKRNCYWLWNICWRHRLITDRLICVLTQVHNGSRIQWIWASVWSKSWH